MNRPCPVRPPRASSRVSLSRAAEKRKRHLRQRRLWCELLERRDLLAASLDGLHLVYDTGPSNSDLVTADPQVAAFISGCSEGNSVEAQFDHFGDGNVDGYSYVYYAGQELTYDPRSFDYTLASYSGSFTLNYRAIERDAMYNVVSESAWQSFTFTLQPPPIPEIAVTYADPYYGYQTEMYDGSSSVSFGTTAVDGPVSQTFTVSNPGTGVLTLELSSLTLPPGFSLIGRFPDSIDAGDSATFTVRLDAAAPGFFSGPLSFSTNDGDEDPFDFYLDGEVTAR